MIWKKNVRNETNMDPQEQEDYVLNIKKRIHIKKPHQKNNTKT